MRSLRLLLCVLFCSGCAHTRNYDDPVGPLFAGGVTRHDLRDDTLLIVSFNLNYGREMERVAEVLRSDRVLIDADVVLLQEIDQANTAWLARELGRAYVHVPASWHPVSGRDYGNAVLSAWPIVGSQKILLPHLGIWRNSRRAAAAATLCVGSTPVRVYAAHLGTISEISPVARREQLGTVLDDAEPFSVAIIGGDFNSGGVADAARSRGYAWPTEGRGATKGLWAVDHVLVRGVEALDAGVARIPADVSDHRPVWTTVRLEGAAPGTACGPE